MSLELVRNWLPARHVLTTVVLEADDEVSHVVSLLLVGVLFLCLCDPEDSSISSKSKMASSWATVLLFISLAMSGSGPEVKAAAATAEVAKTALWSVLDDASTSN